MLVLQLDYFLIAYFLSARDLIEYNFISRVFMAAFGFYSIILTNFYPVCAKLTYSHEWGLLKKHTIQHLTIGFLLVIFSLLCFMFARDQLSRYFLKNSVDLQLSIIVMFGIYYFIRVWTDTFAVLLTILNQGNYMFKIVIFQIMISAPLQVLLIRKFELIGLMVGLIFSFIPTSAVFFPKMVMKFSKVRIG
jgi:O-antigen/teichoic acid export membrane protein